MKKLKNFIKNLRTAFIKKPDLIIPVAAITAFLAFALIESGRAWLYLNSVDEYKNSASVMGLHDTVDKLQRSVETKPAAYYCSLSTDDLLGEFNQAYEDKSSENSSPENLIPILKKQLEEIKTPPAFSSLMNFLPTPREARKTALEMTEAVARLEKLTAEDLRSKYCIDLEDVLARIYFLQNLTKKESVSALLPGQLENFQVNVKQAQEVLSEIKIIPKSLVAEHEQIAKTLAATASNLRQDSNKYETFARRVQRTNESLQESLSELREKTADLQKAPQEIALQASYL